jgi:uncharacterized iron-regulated protein
LIRRCTRLLALVLIALAACAHRSEPAPEALIGAIWDTRAERFASRAELIERARRARYVLLGETHDNAEHHRLQLGVIEALAAHGQPRVLAMEQFDSDYQAALDAARASGADAERLADAGRFDRKGWNWPLYRPLVQFALERGWPLAAANLSRSEARAIVGDPARSALAPAPQPVRSALERDIIDGHCGAAPASQQLAGMVEAQRARDARMAQVLSRAGAGVLITGVGHARRDRGVPLYLPGADLLSIAFVEVQEGKRSPRDYYDGFASSASYDYLWFTPRAQREDPCKP